MQLIDTFGRIHTSLRISVTDRCNIRCFYCMPEHVTFLPRHELLDYDEITRVARILSELGVRKIRLTGGEPLVRRDLIKLIEKLRQIDSIDEIAMTTNGLLLADHAHDLKAAGLDRINVSLDSVDPKIFERITRRGGLEQVLAGIKMAQHVGFDDLRINAVAIKNLSEPAILPLADFCAQQGLRLRFIEFMPLDADQNWENASVLSGEEILATLSAVYGEPSLLAREDPSQPATDVQFANRLVIGMINSVTQPFCGMCNRLRLTAEGQLRNCLFSTVDFDLRQPLRNGANDDLIRSTILDCVQQKKHGHGINSSSFERPDRAMYQIGG